MKNLILITHNFLPESVGGASRTYEMAKYLQQFFNVTVICPPPTIPFTKFKKIKQIFSKENFNGIKLLRIWTFQPSEQIPTFIKRMLYYTMFPILTSIIFFYLLRNADIVIVSTPPPSLLLTVLPIKLMRKKLIIDIRDLWTESVSSFGYVKKNGLLTKFTKKFEIFCWNKANLVITNSLVIVDEIESHFKKKSKRVEYFPFNVDTRIFKKIDIKKEKTIVYTGNFGIAQNLEVFIHAISYAMSLSAFSDYQIHLYGGGDCEQDLKNLVKRLKLENIVKFFEPVPRTELPNILSKAILGIVPLADKEWLRYAMPTKTFEYIACNLPVLGYGFSEELERVVKESNAGIFIKGNEPEKISDNLIKMISDDKMLEKFSSNANQYIQNRPNYSFLREI